MTTTSPVLTPRQQFLSDLWDEHMLHEFGTQDTEETLETMTPRARPSQPTATGVSPSACDRATASTSDGGRCCDHSSRSRGRPTRTAWPSTMPCTPRPSWLAKSSTAGI